MQRRWRDIVMGIVLAAAALVAGLAWAVASPLGASPDDDFHMTNIWCPPPLTESGCRVSYDATGRIDGVYVPAPVDRSSACYAYHPETSAGCTNNLSANELSKSDRFDTGAYPGPYYRFMHLFVGSDVAVSVLVMRAFNVALAVGLLTALAFLLPRGSRRLATVAPVVSIVPLGMFLIASVNPSSWAFTGVTVCWLAVYALLHAERPAQRWGSAALVVLGATVASVSRADACAYVVAATVVLCLVHLNRLRTARWAILAPLAACAIGVWFFFSSAQRAVLSTGMSSNLQRNPVTVFAYNLLQLPGLLAGVFGLNWGLGWLDTAVPAITYVGALGVAIVVITMGLTQLTVRKTLGFLMATGLLIALPLYVLEKGLDYVGANVQPRYLLPLVPLVIGVALMNTKLGGAVRLTGFQATLLYLILVPAHAAALYVNLRRYVTGTNGSYILGTDIQWWWSFAPSPLVVWGAGSVAFAIVALSLFATSLPSLSAGGRVISPQPPVTDRQPESVGAEVSGEAPSAEPRGHDLEEPR